MAQCLEGILDVGRCPYFIEYGRRGKGIHPDSRSLVGNIRPIMHRIFHDDLQLHPRKMWVLQEITYRDQQYRHKS